MQAYFGSAVCRWKQSVRYEDIRTVFDLFQSGYFFFTFDLKSGYHHIEIFPDHRQYLGFSWRFDFGVKYFVFSVLPFGLSSAPYIFTKLVRALAGSGEVLVVVSLCFLMTVLAALLISSLVKKLGVFVVSIWKRQVSL